ncbi:MAG: hypothetical protein U0031_16735 [Thermomicrobiales bacterium]
MVVNTVTGPVASADLGMTLIHEHILLDLTCWWQEPETASRRALAEAPVDISILRFLLRDPQNVTKDNLRLDDIEVAAEEVRAFGFAGGSTIVEVSSRSLARDPLGLKKVSQVSGVNIVMGCGYYCEPSHPVSLASRTVDDIAAEMISDITAGVRPSGIKAGIIGEIGTSATMTPTEEKVLRAAARASLDTGVSMVIHVDTRGNEARRIVEVLESEGARLDRAVMSHQDVVIDIEAQAELARKGAYIAYDTFGQDCYIESWVGGQQFPTDTQRILALKELIALGRLDQILISQDVCMKTQLHRYGRWGYDHILVNVVPMMRRMGMTESEIHTILVENPRRMVTPMA